MEKIDLDWYQAQIALLDEIIENSRKQKQLVTSMYVTKMESEGWVYINTERWDYDSFAGTSPRLLSAELATKMGISRGETVNNSSIVERKYWGWHKNAPELQGLYTKVLETKEWIKNNEILLNSLVEDSYEP